MKLTFPGTRGYTDVPNRRHRVQSALEVVHESTRIMVDRGEDWRGRLETIDPDRASLSPHYVPSTVRNYTGPLGEGQKTR